MNAPVFSGAKGAENQMLRRVMAVIDPFVVGLVGTVVLASIFPVRGALVPWFSALANAGIILLFFLHGAKLSREAILNGLSQWRLHLLVLATTFGVFPLLGLGFSALPVLPKEVAMGMLFLTLLPSTVQSSIALTALARGNVPAAVCTAAFSNLAGVVATPLLVALMIGNADGEMRISTDAIGTIFMQLLLPFIVGHLLRPLVGGFVARQKKLVTMVDRGSILMVVFTAFSAAVVDHLWDRLSLTDLIILTLCVCLLLLIVLLLTHFSAKYFGLDRADGVVLQFCGAQKSLASGVPMAGVLFPAAQVGMMILPVMLYHQIQLIVCAVLARHYADQPDDGVEG